MNKTDLLAKMLLEADSHSDELNFEEDFSDIIDNEKEEVTKAPERTSQSVLKDQYDALEDNKEVSDVEGLIDDVLIITDPDVGVNEYEEVIERAKEILKANERNDKE